MKITIIAYSILALAVSTTVLYSESANAGGTANCPAFTTGMVDAAGMAFGLDHSEIASISVGDDPRIPVIFCMIQGNQTSDRFLLEVNYSVLNQAFVQGRHFTEETPAFTSDLWSNADDLSLPQLYACRAAILKSFVWNNYCAPELQ